MKKNSDVIIVGQGLAGTLLAHALLKLNAGIIIIDPGVALTSSNIAAGIIHPVTGRRIVKSWKAETLIPAAMNIYNDIALNTGVDFFHPIPIVEIYQSIRHRNDWISRSGDPLMQNFIGNEISAKDFDKSVNAPYGGILLRQSAWLDVKKFIDVSRSYFRQKGCLLIDTVQENEISFENKKVKWNNISANKMIYCNGSLGIQSSFFGTLPFLLSKGEIIEFESRDLDLAYILNKGVFILPIGNQKFKAGSTFSWDDIDQIPTAAGRQQLTDELDSMINVRYTVLNHQAAIRPTTRDRRPFIGLNKENPELGIFNGLGTKGVMIAPYYAEQFARNLFFNDPIDADVSISRFQQ